MDITDHAMRILAALVLAQGGEIKVHRDSLAHLGDGHHLDCFMDGPLVVVRVWVEDKAKAKSSGGK